MLTEPNLVEVLHKKKLPRLDYLLIILSVNCATPKPVSDIKKLGRNAGITEILKWNVSAMLARSKGLAINLRDGWALSSPGKERVQKLGVLPEKKSQKKLHIAEAIRKTISQISNPDIVVFLSEAVDTFEMGAYRSTIVLSWVGAVALLHEQIMAQHLIAFNAEASRRDPKWKDAKIVDDLSRMKECDFLDIIGSPPISLIGSSVKDELKNCLKLRNGCGHPNSMKLGELRVSGHLEFLIGNVFEKFS